MARIRTLKPEFFRSRSLAKCDRDARLTFAGLWTEADDHGHGVADPRILKGALWALDDDVTHQHVSAHLRVLVETGHIRLYEVDGETYYEVVNWSEHQAAAYRRGEPKHPAPETYLEDVSHVGVQESAGRTTMRAGREGKGREETLSVTDATDDEFESFWTAYPRHHDTKALGGGGVKKAARKAWDRLSHKQRDDVIAALEPYAKVCRPDGQKPKNAERFLKNDAWTPYLPAARDGPRGRPCPECDRDLDKPDHDELCAIFSGKELV